MSRAFTVIDAEQRSLAWFKARAGRLTASRAKDMLATIKSGEAAARRDLRVQLVCERLTGEPQEDAYVNADMKRGVELEDDAFAAYEALTGQMASRCGFLAHNELLIGCSPDGVIDGYIGIVELKVPRSATHLGYLRAGTLPTEHRAQVTHSLLVTGAAYCDFLSFDPRFPAHLQTFYVRVKREGVDLKAHELAVRMFLSEVETEYQAVRSIASVIDTLRAVVA
jgi:hypothetical protein